MRAAAQITKIDRSEDNATKGVENGVPTPSCSAGTAYLAFVSAQDRDFVAAYPECKSGNSSCVSAGVRLYLSRSLISS